MLSLGISLHTIFLYRSKKEYKHQFACLFSLLRTSHGFIYPMSLYQMTFIST